MAKYAGRGRNASVRLTLVYCVLLSLSAFACPRKPCLHRGFIFSTASPNTTFTVAEREIISLPFRLDTVHCPANRNQTYVYVKTPENQDFCALRFLQDGGCKSTDYDKCACVDDKEAVLTKTAKKADSGVWVWRTGDGLARSQIRFDVREANEESGLTGVSSSETKQGRELDHSPKGEKTVVQRGPAQQDTSAASLTVRVSDKTHGLMRFSPEGADEDANHHDHRDNILITGQSLDKADDHAENYGGIIGTVIVVIIVVVGVVLVVFFYRRKLARKERATIVASTAYADVTDDAVMRERSGARDDEGNSYVPLCLVRHSGEEAPETFINEAYLMTIPRKQSSQEGEAHA